MKFRYDTSGTWYKGNTHIHTQASDGGLTYAETADLYAEAGYDFIFYTDHWVSSDVGSLEVDSGILLLDGIELDGFDSTGAYYHVVCLGHTEGILREDGFDAALARARKQGALTVLAHPHWTGNTFEDALRWNYDAVEVYNNVCHWLNGKGSGVVHWNVMLKTSPGVLAFAADDAHLRPSHPAWNGGWIMVNAPDLSTSSIVAAIRKGNFIATQGPRIQNLTLEGESLHIEASPLRYVRLVGPDSRGQRLWTEDGSLMTSVIVDLPQTWDYVYLEVEDAGGKIAWTNTLYV